MNFAGVMMSYFAKLMRRELTMGRSWNRRNPITHGVMKKRPQRAFRAW